MKRASISEAKNRLSALLEKVKQGQSIVIEDRGVPVARLEPITAVPDPGGRLARLERQGFIRRAKTPLDMSLLRTPPPAASGGPSASEILIEERRDGR